MSDVINRLAEVGLSVPPAPQALGDYVPAVRCENLVFTAGQLPVRDGVLVAEGRVGADVTLEQAQEAAQIAALNALAAASTVCDLDSVERVVKLTGYVSSAEDFVAQPTVVNGASGVMKAAFGEAGLHAREAVGVASLPLGAPVEISLVLQLARD